MAVLVDADRKEIWALFMSDAGTQRDQLALLKTDLRAAIDAADAWVEANSAAYNAALPQPARGALTAKQKAQLLMYVVRKRYQVG